MDSTSPLDPVFNDAANRRAHDLERLPPVLKERARALKDKFEKDCRATAAQQQADRLRDIAEQKEKTRRGQLSENYVNRWRAKPRTEADITRIATSLVDRRNRQTLKKMGEEYEQRIDDILALHRNRDPSIDRDRRSIDVLKQQKRADREATQMHGNRSRDTGSERER